MSNIQTIRNTVGFTRMDNDLYEALIGAELSGRELRVALAIHRLTAGYNVSEARIAASVIATMSGIHREDVSRAICELIRQNVIQRSGGSRSPMSFVAIDQWRIDTKNTHQAKRKEVPQCGVSTTSNVAFLPHYKERNTESVPSELVAAVAATPVVETAKAEQPDDLIADQPKTDTKADRVPYNRIREIYNRVCGNVLPRCAKLNDKRRSLIKKCWNFDLDGTLPFRTEDFWEGYFNDCLTNPHWIGQNDRNWKADIEFLTRESSVLRVLEATQ